MNHHRRIKGCLIRIADKSQKELNVSIFPDLMDSLLVCDTQALLDEQRSKRKTNGLCRSTNSGTVGPN
jgi:hypothetical protein